MAVPTPEVDAALELIEQITACLTVNGLHVPANRGVTWCGECIYGGCCDHLVAVMDPSIDRNNCIADQWLIPVLYGVCYKPCTSMDPNAGAWLADQQALARQLEQVLSVMLSCGTCNSCTEPRSVKKFCEGGCAGFRVTYRLSVR